MAYRRGLGETGRGLRAIPGERPSGTSKERSATDPTTTKTARNSTSPRSWLRRFDSSGVETERPKENSRRKSMRTGTISHFRCDFLLITPQSSRPERRFHKFPTISMYSPKIDEELIPRLYRLRNLKKMPITGVVTRFCDPCCRHWKRRKERRN